MAQKITPNQYDLTGQGVRIVYSTSSIAGSPELTFTKSRKTLTFTGTEIGVLETNIGTLVTVTIAATPDKSSTTFSMLLPAIDLAKETSKQAFRTIGIITIHKTSIAGPVKGVQQTHKSTQLKGTAQRVVFLAKKTATA
jgi:hypothetical protein